MGEYFAQHFVCAYHQVGDFKVVNVAGEIKKTGGNVASYFCDADGRVLNAVAGPKDAQLVLSEAQWAVDAYHHLQELKPQRRSLAMAQAHHARGAEFSQGLFDLFNNHRQVRVHDLLAQHGYPLLEQVYAKVFTRILGEKLSEQNPQIDLARRLLQHAKSTERPILFILHDDCGSIRANRDWVTTQSKYAPLRAISGAYVQIILPTKKLPEFSSFTKQPPYELQSDGRYKFVITDSQGVQMDGSSSNDHVQVLASALARGVITSYRNDPPALSEIKRALRTVEKISEPLAEQLRSLYVERREALAQLKRKPLSDEQVLGS